MRTLYLIRHARPAVEGVLLGRTDPPLAPGAREQAARELGKIAVERVYSSPLRRALETADCLCCPSGVTVLEDLAEISMGAWDGKSWSDVERDNPALARRKSEDWFGVTPPGGEAWDLFARRVAAALEAVRGGPAPAAIVAHLAVNSVLAASVAGVSAREFRQAYGEVMKFDI